MQKLFGTVAFQAVSGRKLKREGTENSRSIYSATDNSQPKTVIHKDKQATQTYHNTSIHSPLSRVRYKEFRGRRSRRSRGTCTSVKPWGKWGMIWKIDWTSWMDDLFRLIVWPDTSPFPSLYEKTLIQVKVPQVGTVLSPLAEILELELSNTSWSCERTWQCRNATFFEAYLELPWPLHLGLKALKSDMWVLKSHYYIEFWMSSKNHVKHFRNLYRLIWSDVTSDHLFRRFPMSTDITSDIDHALVCILGFAFETWQRQWCWSFLHIVWAGC